MERTTRMLRNLNIRTLLLAGLGFVLMLVVGLVALVWYQTDHAWQHTRQLYDQPLQVRRALDGLGQALLRTSLALNGLVHVRGDAEREELLRQIAAQDGLADRQYALLADRYLGPREDADALRGALDGWRAARDETARLVRAGRGREAAERLLPAGANGVALREATIALETIGLFAQERTDRFFREIRDEQELLLLWLPVVAGAIVLLMLGVGLLLWGGIRRPLRELVRAADRFRLGDLAVRSRHSGTNEFGALAAAFNALVDTVQADRQRREAAERISRVMLREAELRPFCRRLLVQLIEETGSQIGALYLPNEERTAFDHFESVGLQAAGRASFSAAGLEGEFGHALATGRLQRVTEIPPETRFGFATVAGEFRPGEILTIPIAGEEGTAAVISLASVRPYPEAAVRLVGDLLDVITARLNGVLAADRIRLLAERLDGQNQELQLQQEELEAQAEELREQNEELELQQRMLEEAGRLKSQFLSNMSHELRTPLNSVLALARVLAMQAGTRLDAEEHHYLEIIERNGKNLLELINDLLDLARIEAGRMELQPRPFPLRQTLENVVESLAPLAREKRIALDLLLPEALPAVESDEVRVTQVLMNLIGNAVKFTDAGSVGVSAAFDERRVEVRVADSGIGIAACDLEAIFDEFRQADGSTSRRHDGTGLGLAIARKTARLLGGDIAVESTPGEGSAFTLTLPVAWPEGLPRSTTVGAAADGGTRAPVAITGADGTGRDRRILLVEDNAAATIQVASILRSAGFRVDPAADGREALDYLAATVPDGIVLDLMMPGIDGFAVLERIRGTAATAAVPVLVLTAKELEQEEIGRLAAGRIRQLVQKGDVDRARLVGMVRAMVGPDDTVRPV